MTRPTFGALFALVGVFAVALVTPVIGQGALSSDGALDDFGITRWERFGGSPTELIMATAQDSAGYLWLGSNEGLTRFDGFTFQRWSSLAAAPLAGTNVRTLFVDRAGILWIGFEEGGVSRVDGTSVRNYSSREGLPAGGVLAMVQDNAGTLWVGTRAGLFSFKAERWTRTPVTDGLPDGPVFSALPDATGSLFVGTREAIFRRRAGGARFELVDAHSTDNSIGQSLCKDSDGHIVTTDATRGFRVIDRAPEHRLPPAVGAGLRLLCGRDGTIWVGTLLTGLWRVAPGGRDETQVIRTRLLSQAVVSVLEDRDQNIWVTSNGGLYRLTPRSVRTLRGVSGPTALASDALGQMLVGTIDGLVRFVRHGNEWVRATTYFPGAQIRSVLAEANGTVWVATSEGVKHLTRAGVAREPSWGATLLQVTSLASSIDGTLWLYDTSLGLCRFGAGRLDVLELSPELRGVAGTVLHVDRRRRLWLVNERGVELRSEDGDIRRYSSEDGLDRTAYRSIYEDAAGVIWLGSTSGLSRIVDGHVDSVRIGGVRRVRTIVEDAQGVLWLGLERGGVRVSRPSFQDALAMPHRLLLENYGVFDGLPGTIRALSDGVGVQSPDGHLWFTTDEGVAIVDPDSTTPSHGTVQVRLTSVAADDRPMDTTGPLSLIGGTKRVHLAWAALDLTTPERVRFRYRLDGFDRDWREGGATPEAEYSDLAAGSYVFRVVAAREGEKWTDSGDAVEFSVAPRLYQTAWFPLLLAGVIASASWATWHIRLAQARKRFAIMLAERARVSREVHDTLLQSMVGVALQCQALAESQDTGGMRDRLVQLRRRIDEHIDEGRDLIWHLRSPSLERYDLVSAIQRMADHLVTDTGVHVVFTSTGTAQGCSSRAERELLRIGQEAITNAVRHGRPTTVTIELAFGVDSLRLRVTDDGCGFDPPDSNALSERHCGLTMMKERAEDVGGVCTVDSTPGQGTCIEATVGFEAQGS
ncbi:MAG: two-component regulator propeller domain-containing protein [Vicinamibacterales bacterium]